MTSATTSTLLLLSTLMLRVASTTAQLTFLANTTDVLRDTITDGGDAAVASATNDDLRIGPSVSAVVAIVAGVALCFYGFRLMRPTMFACGFLVGGFLCASAANVAFHNQSYEATAWWIALLVGGVLVGVLVLVLYSTGIFIVGAAGGVLLATLLNTSVGYKLAPNDPNTSLLVLVIVLGLLGGLLAWKLEKPVIVVATSLVGAVLTVAGIGYFAKNFPDASDLQGRFGAQDAATGEWHYDMPEIWWVYVAAMCALFALGAFVQFKMTSGLSSNSSRSVKTNNSYSHA